MLNQDTNTNEDQRKFSRTWTETLAFPRMFTHNFDFANEENWAKMLLEEYQQANNKGPEGDIPIPEGFGKNKQFRINVILTIAFGLILGVIGVVFMNLADEVILICHFIITL